MLRQSSLQGRDPEWGGATTTIKPHRYDFCFFVLLQVALESSRFGLLMTWPDTLPVYKSAHLMVR